MVSLSSAAVSLLLTALLSCCPPQVASTDGSGRFVLYNAETDQPIVDLINGTVIALSDIAGMMTNGPSFNIEVSYPTSLNVGSVKFGLDGDTNVRTERKAPYALCGNQGTNYFLCDRRLFGLGTHTVTATPYKPAQRSRFPRRGNAAAPAGNAVAVTFSIVSTKPPTSPRSPIVGTPPSAPMTAPISTCREAKTCVSCLDLGCGWPNYNQCVDTCNSVVDIPCYNNRSSVPPNVFAGLTVSQQVCAKAERDAVDVATCVKQTNCTSCVSTLRADKVSVCRWFPLTGSPQRGYCSIDFGRCFLNGCGTTTCPTAISPMSPISTTPDATKAPISPLPPMPMAPSAPSISVCQAARNRNASCVECLDANCAWLGGCRDSCRAVVDIKCYDNFTNPGNVSTNPLALTTRSQQVCAKAERDRVDTAACAAQTNCKSCVNTIRADGVSVCYWYSSPLFSPQGGGRCSMDRCFIDGCGSTTCPAVILPPAMGPTAPPAPSFTKAPKWTSRPVTQPPTRPPTYCRQPNLTCTDCLTANCGWLPWSNALPTNRFCIDTCRLTVDVKCYDNYTGIADTNIANNNTLYPTKVSKVCAEAERDRANWARCQSQGNCTTCTNTSIVLENNRPTVCSWYSFAGNTGFCSYQACDFLLGCGKKTCPAS